jgi:hypothetical protein
MNLSLIGILIRLRYKLLWARVRSSNTKLALFFAGYLLLLVVMALVSVSGVGTGMQAIRSGKGTLVGDIALAGLYTQALFASLVLGFGMAATFSETELRRFPLKTRERRFVRHLIGIADPFWYLFLAMYRGMALGLYLLGTGSAGFGVVAILMLFLSNYVSARVLGILVDRLMLRKAGSAALILLAMICAIAPALLVQERRNPSVMAPLKLAWSFLPPAGAAAAMTQTGLAALPGLGVVFVWLIVPASVLVVLERRPPALKVAQTTAIVWSSPIDRLGALFGARHGALVALWLRFFSRNNRFRAIYPLELPLFAFLIFLFDRLESKNPFALSIAAFSTLGLSPPASSR